MSQVTVLVDGYCSLCKGWTLFVARRDRFDRLRFASQQSDAGERVLRRVDGQGLVGESVVVVTGSSVYHGSRGVIEVFRVLPWPWKAVTAMWIVPWFLRDWAYYFVADHRKAWFGEEDVDFCERPDEALRQKRLD